MGSSTNNMRIRDISINDDKFNIWVNELEKEKNRIFSMNTFKTKYLDCCDSETNKDNIECITLDINDKTSYDARFDQFKETVEKLKNFMSSKYKNLNKELQQLIDDYGNNKNPERSKEMINMILNVYQKNIQDRNLGKSNNNENNYDYMELGVSEFNFDKPKLPNYQIYVFLDVIKGEVNNKNKKLIKCNFIDRYLNKGFYKFFLSQTLNNQDKWEEQHYPYVELKDKEDFKKEEDKVVDNVDESEEIEKKKGGKTLRKIKKKKNKSFKKSK
jgi:hypothetical protein